MKWISILVLGCMYFQVSGQTPDTLFYDVNWQLTEPETAVFYRVAHVDRNILVFDGPVKDYILYNQQLIMEGNYDAGKKEGIFFYYSADGALEGTGKYENNKRTGQWNFYFPNQQLHKEVLFSSENNSYEMQLYSLYDTTGRQLVKEGNGFWQEYSTLTANNRTVVLQGKVVNGKKDEMWVLQYTDGKKILEELHMQGEFRYGDAWEEDKKYPYYSSKMNFVEPSELTYPEIFFYDTERYDHAYYGEGLEYFLSIYLGINHTKLSTQSNYRQVNNIASTCDTDKYEPAFYEGGPLALYLFVDAATLQTVEPSYRKGKIIVNFTVNQYGRAQKYFVSKGLTTIQNNHAIEIVKKTRWIPAACNGKATKSYLRIAINY